MGATLSWASAQVVGKVALRKIDALSFNAVRFFFATVAIALGGFLFGSFEGIELGYPLLSAVLSGVFGWFVATFIFFFVLKRGSAHRIIPAGNAYPFWAILFGALFLGENLSVVIPFSAALVFLGTFLLSRRGKKDLKEWKYGIPLASIVAVLWGANAVLNKFALGEMSVSSVLLVRVVSATVLFWLVFGIMSLREKPSLSKKSLGLSVLSGLIAFPIGSLLYVSALVFEEASTLAPITGATVLFGFLLSVAFLGESPTKKAVLGMLSIFGGILLMFFC